MKISNAYQKFFMQVWLFILSVVVFVFGILMLTDLDNYRYVLTEGTGSMGASMLDENGERYIRISIKCKTELVYYDSFDQIVYQGYNVVDDTSGYKVKDYKLYLDVIYEREKGKGVLIETICADEYSKDYYDLEYANWIKIVPRLENIKYEYPAWRIYVPIMIFVFTLPIMLLSGYLIAAKIVARIKFERESVMPVEEG